jgi:hypothetical protein
LAVDAVAGFDAEYEWVVRVVGGVLLRCHNGPPLVRAFCGGWELNSSDRERSAERALKSGSYLLARSLRSRRDEGAREDHDGGE